MDILYIAYSCSPNHGSEDRIGWKIATESAKTNNVTVITKAEHRQVIEKYLAECEMLNIRFHYVDIPAVYKKVFKGPAYSGRLNAWQKRALALAKSICSEGHIDLIHQITPVEFRSIGDYGSIDGVRFVCGPIGGGEYIPHGLRSYAGRHIIEEFLRKVVNRRSLRRLERRGCLDRCDVLLFANEETAAYLSRGGDSLHRMTEIGISEDEMIAADYNVNSDKFIFLIAGRLNYRKGHRLLFDALSQLPSEDKWECHIVGTGPELKKLKKRCSALGMHDRVRFFGRVPFEKMEEIYRSAHVLVLPSLRETTGSVVLEAMARGLPVITIDAFGAGLLVSENNGWTYSGSNKADYINNLSAVLSGCLSSKTILKDRSEGALRTARENTWGSKIDLYNSIYSELCSREIK